MAPDFRSSTSISDGVEGSLPPRANTSSLRCRSYWSARGPANANLGLRISRTWTFGKESRGLTIGAATLNALNHPNFTPPVGNLSSPYFGQSRALGGLIVMQHGGAPTTYNRKIDLQVRITF